MKATGKPALVPMVRFPEFREAEGWEEMRLIDTADRSIKWSFIGGPFGSNLKSSDYAADGVRIIQLQNIGDGEFFDNYRIFTTTEKADELKNLPMRLPKRGEQQKIAECLSSVDEVIAAQARKLDALQTHKKGLMQQLFPREGETQPRLRFPEFQAAGEWEEDKLGSVCELYQAVTLSSSELTMTGEHLVYGANGIIGSHNDYNHEESEIAVTCRGATCGEVTTTKPKSWITGNAMVVKPRTKKLMKDFISQYFKNHGLKSVISGSAQPQITRAGFAPLMVFFPKPAEQQRIADCLTTLDDLIAAQTQKLAALKTHKRGLMQQLFPSPEAVAA